ncbi:MAG: 1,4-alpha-glucan branching protein GlgB, partial [Methylocystaceae bacterium]|nr:1,4-alpha-glucan branching protein GlgB [Methylocystaceae bacterium]
MSPLNKALKIDGPNWHMPERQIWALVQGRHDDPFSVLGLHQYGSLFIVRAFIAGARKVEVETLEGRPVGELSLRHEAGFFEGPVRVYARQILRYRASNDHDQWETIDPYLFGPVLGPMDDYYLAEGTHLNLYDRLGAHNIQHEGIAGIHFALWAPNAKRVSIVGDFNHWDGRRHVMRKRGDTGVWEIFIPDAKLGQSYKYEIISPQGQTLPLKSDPFGFYAERRPSQASIIYETQHFEWTDQAYLDQRAKTDPRQAPISIYEVHLGSWKRKENGDFLSYQELAEDLIPYVKHMGFTHIELMPINEHPYDPSWGYQPVGLYAPTSRYGDPTGFAHFIDHAHAHGLGVILDWVPAHFPIDEHGLARFDGTALYEHEDPRQGYHPDWKTAIYNYGRREVQAFLINNALFWLKTYHIDGLRVDAVASMLYLDYSRQEGQWVANQYGTNENIDAISFLRRLNEDVYRHVPGILTIAEESTAFAGVSHPTHAGGLGFGFKWNMGFMHDTLRYLKHDPIHRKHHHQELTFSSLYAFSENFILPLSHDEVVHGKGSLLTKMSGDDWQKFAHLRAYYAYMWGHPGKKLLFMGQEIAPWTEWSEARVLDWSLLSYAPHAGMQLLLRDLNQVYARSPALYELDCETEGLEWLIADDHANSIYAWARHSKDRQTSLIIICNFTPIIRRDYLLPLP